MEPVAHAAAAAASAIEKSGLLPRLLGPLADEIGADLVARHRQRNAEKIARKAIRRLGAKLDQDGAVHPRVAHRVFEEGSYTNDEVMLEYLAGTLAAGRTPDGRDDRAAYYSNLVAALSANQIRLHHAVYSALATAHLLDGESFGDRSVLPSYTVFTTVPDAAALIEGPDGPAVDAVDLVGEAVLGLYREGLVGDHYVGYPLTWAFAEDEVETVQVTGTHVGLILFLWAYGFRDGDVDHLARCLDCPFEPPGPVFARYRLAPRRRIGPPP